MAESSPDVKKTLRENEKFLVTGNFSFSHSVFKRLNFVLQTRKSHGLFGKGLTAMLFYSHSRNISLDWSTAKAATVGKFDSLNQGICHCCSMWEK